MDVVGPHMSCFLEPGASGGQGKLEGEGCCRRMLLADAAVEECYSGRDAEAEWMQEYGGCWVMGGSVG